MDLRRTAAVLTVGAAVGGILIGASLQARSRSTDAHLIGPDRSAVNSPSPTSTPGGTTRPGATIALGPAGPLQTTTPTAGEEGSRGSRRPDATTRVDAPGSAGGDTGSSDAAGGSSSSSGGTVTGTRNGEATHYDLSVLPNCSFPAKPADDLYVAVSPTEYAGAAACGETLSVTGPNGTVRVKVIDRCPECAAGHIDLSRAAFAKIADPVDGIVDVTYSRVVDPALSGGVQVRVKEGSSQFWLALLLQNTGNPVTSVQVRSGSGAFKTATRADFNYWIVDGGAGAGPFTVKVTDDRGHTATLTNVQLSVGTVQTTSTRMY